MLEPLPAFIRAQREQQNLTLVALARKSGVSRRTISDLENGRVNITIGLLVKLARALELSDLPIGDLRMRGAPPEFTPLHEMQHQLIMARQAIRLAQAELARVSERLGQLLPQLALALDPDDAHAFMERLLELERGAIARDAAVTTATHASARSETRMRRRRS